MTGPLEGRAWVEAENDSARFLYPVLLTLIAWRASDDPVLIGTAFIQNVDEKGVATAFTAAHNIDEIKKVQHGEPTATWLPPDLQPVRELSLDRTRVCAIYRINNSTGFCEITSVVWDSTHDIAVLAVESPSDDNIGFDPVLPIGIDSFEVGDLVALAGMAEMYIPSNQLDPDGVGKFQIRQRLSLRTGTVTAVYSEGHVFSQGRCIETSIPVFSGMSGGPVFRLPNDGAPIVAVGIITSDQVRDAEPDFSQAGSTIVSLFTGEITNDERGEVVKITLPSAEFASNG